MKRQLILMIVATFAFVATALIVSDLVPASLSYSPAAQAGQGSGMGSVKKSLKSQGKGGTSKGTTTKSPKKKNP
jgi:hypothetical protein